MSDETDREFPGGDEPLAERIAELSDRIAQGAQPEIGPGDVCSPAETNALQRLMPAIRLLSDLANDELFYRRRPCSGQPANVLGDFRLGREIGRGGIGIVYEAEQISLGRRVAVKVLAPSSRLDHRQRRRFAIEAQAAAGLQHPNIVPVIAYGDESGVPYLAMRLIEGRNIAEMIRELRKTTGRGFPPREAADLARQAAEAVEFAHQHDVLHRDLKPSNFLIDAGHRLWVADFGLARVQGDSDLTTTGDLIGTVRYLSPEQAKGKGSAIDGRSDVYALGATLYEMLTLRPVFEGDDRAELLFRIASEERRFARHRDDAIPRDLRTIVLKALAKDPADRYQTADELDRDLTLFLADQPIRAQPPTVRVQVLRWARQRSKAVAIACVMMALLLVGLAGASLWSNARLRSINQRLEEEIERSDRLAHEAQDQARLLERHASGAQIRLASQAVDAGQAERAQEILSEIPPKGGGEAARSFAWRYLWRRARRDVVVLVGPTPNFGHLTLSPDGKILATTDPTDGLVLRQASTGTPIRSLVSGSDPLGRPAFSPDGVLVAAVHTNADPATPDGITVWEIASGRRLARIPVARGPDGCRCGFSPGGALLVTVFGLNEAQSQFSSAWDVAKDPCHPRPLERFDGIPAARMDWSGGDLLIRESRATASLRDPITAGTIRTFHIQGSDREIIALACSAGAERVAAVSTPPWRLTVWDGKTGDHLADHEVTPGIVRLTMSPVGTLLAAVDNRQDVYLIDWTSGAARRIVSEKVDHPRIPSVAFSPDGTRLATAISRYRSEDDPSAVSLWDTATGRVLSEFPGRGEIPENVLFAPDGQSLLISSKWSVRRWRLRDVEDGCGGQPAGHKDEAWAVAFAPDGRIVATGSDDSEPDPTVKLWEPATGRLIRAWEGGEGTVSSLAFSPDGRVMASGHIAARGNVRIWETATGRLLANLEGHTDRVRAVAFAGDGRLLGSASSDGTVRLWDAGTWRERQVLRGHRDSVHAVAFAPDGRAFASAGNDGDICLWDIRPDGAGSLRQALHNRTSLMAIAYSPDNRLIAAADSLGSIAIWDIASSKPLRLIHGDGDELRQLSFAPDGTTLAAAGSTGTIRLWDPITGQELLSLPAHRAKINGLAFSPDGSTLASVAHDGTARLWRAEQ